MICPKCEMEALQVDEHTETPARRLCDAEPTSPDKTWLRYHPCGHVVEKPVDLGHQDVETTAATYERVWLNRWVSGEPPDAVDFALAEFLLARVAEREEWAREVLGLCDGIGVTREWRWVRFYGRADLPKMPSSSAFYHGAPTPHEVIAGCEAVEQIVRMGLGATHEGPLVAAPYKPVLRMLALPYAAHPDYREEWRP